MSVPYEKLCYNLTDTKEFELRTTISELQTKFHPHCGCTKPSAPYKPLSLRTLACGFIPIGFLFDANGKQEFTVNVATVGLLYFVHKGKQKVLQELLWFMTNGPSNDIPAYGLYTWRGLMCVLSFRPFLCTDISRGVACKYREVTSVTNATCNTTGNVRTEERTETQDAH